MVLLLRPRFNAVWRAPQVRRPYSLLAMIFLPSLLLAYTAFLSCLCPCGLGICPFSELVCDLLQRQLFHGCQRRIVKEYLSHNLDEHCLEDTWCLSYPSGDTNPWAPHFLVVREIDCGNWFARGYMPAHQHCGLFYPQVGDLLGCALNWVGCSPPVRDSFLGPEWLIGLLLAFSIRLTGTLTLSLRLSQLRLTNLFFVLFLEQPRLHNAEHYSVA